MAHRSIKSLLSSEYFLFGSQYYRAPSPHSEDWEKDISKMAELGFNTIKYWVQWRWNNPAENTFDFSDIDRLMDLASKYGLRVMLNTIFDVAPAWIYKKYPDASMITRDGRKIGPQTQPHRQIGGLGYCLNHPDIQKHFDAFLSATVEHFKNHPALEIWNVGSEPELTSSMAEMREYADDARKMGDMLCYCNHCRNRFKKWLEEKYDTIDGLNHCWNRNYRSFEEAEVPLTRNTFNDMIDWRMFFVSTLGENVKRRFGIAKSIDQGQHPLMCHHVFIQGFPLVSTANDPWNVGQYGDLHGFTQMDDAMMPDVLRSCAKDKPVISAEMLMLPGYTLDLPKKIDNNDIKRFIFSGIAANLKGFIFWQYRPEILGREAPTWGLTHLDGSETPWLRSYAEIGMVLQKNKALLLEGAPQPAQVAMIYNPENQVFAWMSTGSEKSATDALLGTHRALYEHNFNIDLIHPSEFTGPILDKYKCIFVPFPYVLNQGICAGLKKWVAAGGVLIGESYFAGWNIENGHHEKTVPGYGLHEVFQASQQRAFPPDRDGMVEMIMGRDLSHIRQDQVVRGSFVREELSCNGAEVIARYTDGAVAMTMAAYGKGKAFLIGSYLGMAYHRDRNLNNGRLLASLAEFAGIQKPLVEGGDIRIDTISHPSGQMMLIVQNLSDEHIQGRIQFSSQVSLTLAEQFDGKILALSTDGQVVTGMLSLQPYEARVYVAE
ncbi:MAG: hypothetical protein E4H13_07325 [Calditrichales bacterium]|nr:MAG: hypothetical protein E4H13_07325 [Calditrichales bacterium]